MVQGWERDMWSSLASFLLFSFAFHLAGSRYGYNGFSVFWHCVGVGR